MQSPVARAIFSNLTECNLRKPALHAAPDDLAFKDVEGGEQGGGAVALVVVCHRGAAPLLHRQTVLAAIERLDLAFLVDAEDHRRGRWIDAEANDILELVSKLRI